jgi:hypothetical protein
VHVRAPWSRSVVEPSSRASHPTRCRQNYFDRETLFFSGPKIASFPPLPHTTAARERVRSLLRPMGTGKKEKNISPLAGIIGRQHVPARAEFQRHPSRGPPPPTNLRWHHAGRACVRRGTTTSNDNHALPRCRFGSSPGPLEKVAQIERPRGTAAWAPRAQADKSPRAYKQVLPSRSKEFLHSLVSLSSIDRAESFSLLLPPTRCKSLVGWVVTSGGLAASAFGGKGFGSIHHHWPARSIACVGQEWSWRTRRCCRPASGFTRRTRS